MRELKEQLGFGLHPAISISGRHWWPDTPISISHGVLVPLAVNELASGHLVHRSGLLLQLSYLGVFVPYD